jgi:hypothetical protein
VLTRTGRAYSLACSAEREAAARAAVLSENQAIISEMEDKQREVIAMLQAGTVRGCMRTAVPVSQVIFATRHAMLWYVITGRARPL